MSFKKALVLMILVTAATAPGADAQTSRQDIEARINALTPEDTRDLVLKARAGDAMSQYILGRAHKLGKGVARSDAEAVKWIRQAAEQGYVLAEIDLANMYFQGAGVPADPKDGMQWLHKAADHRDSMA